MTKTRASEARPPRDWDATTYDRVADAQEEWGREVLERLDLRLPEPVDAVFSNATFHWVLDHDPFIDAVLERAAPVELDYVRLNIGARRLQSQ